MMKKKGMDEAIVGGGDMLNAGFLKEGLLDEIFLDVESLIFVAGISLFARTDTEGKLRLLETKKISENTVRLHYKIEHPT